jgi:hypothetical protein
MRRQLPAIVTLFAAASIGGAVTAGSSYLFATIVPWILAVIDAERHLGPRVNINDLAPIALLSAKAAVPVALLLGTPILGTVFAWTRWPLFATTAFGGCIGPILLVIAITSDGTLNGCQLLLLSVAILGALGAGAAALFLRHIRISVDAQG